MTAGMIETSQEDETVVKVLCWVSIIMVGCVSKNSVGGRRGDRLGRSLSRLPTHSHISIKRRTVNPYQKNNKFSFKKRQINVSEISLCHRGQSRGRALVIRRVADMPVDDVDGGPSSSLYTSSVH
jgi:hypothetical protein